MTKKTENVGLGIQAVSQQSGLSQHLIRIWERRYGAVEPARTESNRRLYSEDDAHRLELLNRAVHAGHRIGDIARIPTEKLEQLVGGERRSRLISSRPSEGLESRYIRPALEAIERFDAEALSNVFARAEVDLGQARALELIILPLMEHIGTMWQDGELRIAHEHMATAVVTHHVGSILDSFRFEPSAPVIVVATPLGQMHEAGALAVAVVAAVGGWRPIYLGRNLPAEEIAGVAHKTSAKAVALSLVYPADDPRLAAEIDRLGRLLPNDLSVLVGGRAAEAYRVAIEAGAMDFITDVASLRQHLEQIRAHLGRGK
jgi:methanogenic corrinoid protein MtbC1